nr:ribonuclease H-like domain-containing protein [Tanacetum cinerariifolium]
MRPFGCPVTILNTLDHLGKFDGKANEGFFVGYSINSKAFRVFNRRTRIVDETLHITFLENKPNVTGSELTWLFDIDTLTKSMNYKPVDSLGDGFKPSGKEEKKDVKDLGNKDNEDNVVDENIVYGCADDPNMPNLEEIVYLDDDEDVGAKADMTNLDTNIPVSLIPTTKSHKDHPGEQIIRDIHSAPQTRRMTKSVTDHDPSWIEAKRDELLQFKLQQVWTLVDLPNGKRAIGTKWIHKNKKDKETSEPTETAADEAVNEKMYDSLERATTNATSLDAEQDRGGGPKRQDTMGIPLLRLGLRMYLNNPMTHLSQELTHLEGRFDDQEMFDTSVLDEGEEVLLKEAQDVQNGIEKVITNITTARIKETVSIDAPITTADVTPDELTMAQALVGIKKSKSKGATTTTTTVTIPTPDITRPKARGVVMKEPNETPTTTPTIPKSSKLKNKSFDEVQKVFEKTISWINSFVPMDSEVVKDKAVLTQESSSKRAGDKLDQRRSKKQKVEDDKESKELKRCLEIIPDNGDDVTIDATPLSIKTMYYTFSKLLKNFDREDIKVLWSIVKTRFEKVRPVDDMDSFLMHTLKTMFEHHVEDTNTVYYLLVKKMYLLKNHTLHQVFNNVKLQVDEECEMAYKLLRLVKKQLKEGYRAN